MFNALVDRLHETGRWLGRRLQGLVLLYHPQTWRAKGLAWSLGLALVTLLVVVLVLMFLWSREPAPFDVRENALAMAGGERTLVPGYTITATAIRLGETLLDKPGGYLSNDLLPPGVLMDNIPNWEFGVLVQLRDITRAMRNDFSRSQTQSTEDKDLIIAEPQFNFDSDSWILPSTEGEYRQGIAALRRYLARLADDNPADGQFFSRADNLREWLALVEKRLGSLSQRLAASAGQVRVNVDSGEEAKPQGKEMVVKTPWYETDDIFYEARGSAWALLHLLKAVEIDFQDVLQDKNAVVGLRQIIRELEYTQQPLRSPIILAGSGFGVFTNHSLVMASYISRANAAVIDLRNLLEQG